MGVTQATESVLGVIERQRQDQERMLRTLANGKALLRVFTRVMGTELFHAI
jgi:hypothetical protein